MAHHPATATITDGQLPVGTLLAEPLLRGTLVAGRAGLGRGVGWCLPLSETRRYTDASESGPDPDLSGVAVHLPVTALASADEAAMVVADLVRRDAAALLAWRPPGIDTDLDAAARAADAAGVPLLALPAEADYRAVSRLIGQKALAQAAHILEYGTRVHRTLAEVLSRGPGVPAMAHAVVGLSRCSVLICDADGERLAWAEAPGATPPDPDAVLRALPEEPPKTPDGHPHAVEAELRVDPDGPPAHALVTPVLVGGEVFGRLVMIERVCPPDPHDLAQHRVVAEHGATLIGSEMLRQRSVRAAEERARGDFVEALVHGRFADSYELGARARHHGFDVDGHFTVHVVAAASLLPVGRDYLRRTVTATRTAQTLELRGCTLTAAIGSTIVVIRQVTGPQDPLRQREQATRFAERLHRALRPQLGDDLRVTHGRPGQGAAGVAAGYHEARLTMGLAWHTAAGPVCGYDDLRVFAALKDVAGSAEARTFAQETLAPLRRANGGDLERIVLAYIRTSGNLNAAARELGMHRNTMLYKLDRASRALRMDIRSADAQFMFWLAHHIDTLTTVSGTLADELAPPAAAPR